jgi:riboflavin kinase / FMN adenylyltransferase
MKLLRGFSESTEYRGSFVSIGNFDGVHRGHQQMFASLVRHANQANAPSAVFTFEPHPIQLLRPSESPPSLMSLDQKSEMIEACGVDYMVIYPTDLRLLNLAPAEFFESVVIDEFQACGLVEGPNFFFGRDRSGNSDTLTELCAAHELQLDIVPPVFVGTQMVSSSVIRQQILDGNVDDANALLGHRYRVRGQVSKGAERGKTIGFPTANLTHVVTVLPKDGVYAGVAIRDGQKWAAAINLGPNPTFGERRRKLEAHLLDFEGDLYDQSIEIEFVARIRDTQQFPDAISLKAQLEQDVLQVRDIVKTL